MLNKEISLDVSISLIMGKAVNAYTMYINNTNILAATTNIFICYLKTKVMFLPFYKRIKSYNHGYYIRNAQISILIYGNVSKKALIPIDSPFDLLTHVNM